MLFINKNLSKNNEVKRFGRFFSRFFKVANMMPEFLRHHTNHVKPGEQGLSFQGKQVMNIFYQLVIIIFIEHETDNLF